MKKRNFLLFLFLTLSSSAAFADSSFSIIRSNSEPESQNNNGLLVSNQIKTITKNTTNVKVTEKTQTKTMTRINNDYNKNQNYNSEKYNRLHLGKNKIVSPVTNLTTYKAAKLNSETNTTAVDNPTITSFIFSQNKTFIQNVKSWSQQSEPKWKVVFSDKDSSNFNFIPSSSAVFTGTFKQSLSKLIKVLDREGKMYKVRFYSNFTAVIK